MKRKWVLLLYVIVCVLLLVTSTKEDEFVPYYEERREVVLRVESMPDIRGEGTFYVCKVVNIAQNISNFSTNIRLFVKGDGGMYQYGDLLQTIIIFEQPDVATNPGNFNYKNYLLSLNITATATVSSQSDIQCIGNQPANVIVLCGMQCRKAILKLLQTCMPHGSSALIEAMFLGNKEQLDENIIEAFSAAGISHFMAVSGAHAVFFLMPFSFVMQKVKVRKQIRYGIEVLLLFCYMAVAGFGVSVVRAGVMMSLKRIAFLVKRDYDPLIALLFALTVLMIQNPFAILHVGLQLSFGAVLSMHCVLPVLKSYITRWVIFARIPSKFLDGACLCISIQVGTLPILVNQFQMPTVFAIFANLVCSPIVGVIMMGGLVLTVLGTLGLFAIGKVVGAGVYFFCVLVERIALFFASIGKLQTWSILHFSTWQVVFHYVMLIAILFFLKGRWRGVACGVLSLFLLFCSISLPEKELQITCIDVGQGECIYIETPSGKDYLMDCGSSTVKDVAKYRVLPYLKTEKVRTLAGVFLSHYDSDHMSGLEMLLKECKVDVLYLPDLQGQPEEQEMEKLAKQYGTQVCYWSQGDVIKDGKAILQCVHPQWGLQTKDGNAGSMVLKITYGSFDALLTGDLPQEAESAVADITGPCEFLKVGHHGSNSSTGESFLRVIQPCVAFVSCGKNNFYGHPHGEVLQRLEEIGCDVYTTMEGGALTITSNGENIVVTNFL